MWIVRLALRRPYTFTVMAILIVIMGVVSGLRMAKDIFPSIDIPIVVMVWQYGGLSPSEMEKRVVYQCERSLTANVSDFEHIESQSYPGIGVIKIYLQPDASVDTAMAQVAAQGQTIIKALPPGATPPLIVRFSSSSVPILQLALSSKTLPEQTLFDLGLNFVRVPLASVRGASIPLPSGGKSRLISVDIDLHRLQSLGLTPSDVSNAISAENLTLPSGTAKIGTREYNFALNSSPDILEEFGTLPIKVVNGSTIMVRDVAQVRDGFSPQNSIVRTDGTRGALLTVLKNGKSSTLDVIRAIRAALPRVRAGIPPELIVTPRFDQSFFVRAALQGVVREAIIAAALTAGMILLFLGSWRNTLVVAISIPLSIFVSVICLSALGQTLNTMTLGGLALAVGILVDDATVEVENITRNLNEEKPLVKAILDGAQQIAVPAFVSTLCICIVFIPIFFLTGTSKFLFGPLAMAVIFAMLASYFLSRTVVPTFIHYLLIGQPHRHDDGRGIVPPGSDFFWRVHVHFNVHFERFRVGYAKLLNRALDAKRAVLICMLIAIGASGVAGYLLLGRDFFPLVDAGQIRLHVRTPAGTRIEETEHYFTRVEDIIRQEIPANELTTVMDNIGLPNSGLNLAQSDTATIGPSDGEVLVELNQEHHHSTWLYLRKLRARLNRELPDCQFFTQPADIVSQILNSGLPAPIDLQIAGRSRAENYAIAQELSNRIAKIPGAVDVHIHQIVNEPSFDVNVDRLRASQIGLDQKTIASNLLISLSGSSQAATNYWINPQNGVQYLVATQTPQYENASLEAVRNTPVGIGAISKAPEILGNVATIQRSVTEAVVSHYDVAPVYDIYANIDGKDLGSVADAVNQLLPEYRKKLPRGSVMTVRGQAQSMNESFFWLGIGVLFAILLVYFLLVINFQSWIDPFIIIMALPGALCGIIAALILTRTTLNVPSLMGAIMSVGVATANSILVVTFANDQRKGGMDARAAALSAGTTRLRPVIMTALAMIIGMLPMSLGLGEGGEQNAPLGRAVIGGLIIATLATLLFVPVVYAALRKTAAHRPDEEIEEEMHEAHMPGH